MPTIIDYARDGDLAGLTAELTAHPHLLGGVDAQGDTLLHVAAAEGHSAIVAYLLGLGLAATVANAGGNTPLHIVASALRESAPNAAALLDAGAQQNVFNAKGQSPVHLAAFSGFANIMNLLAARPDFAAANAADQRGWTPIDVATGAGKTAIELILYASGVAVDAPPLFILPGTRASPLDILTAATRCENPDHQAVARKAYRQLYDVPELRPILDLAASRCLGDRTNNLALRIFFADDNCSHSVSSKFGASDFNPASNTVAIGARRIDPRTRELDLAEIRGTLVHELTHFAAKVVYNNNAVPVAQGDAANDDAYRQAVALDSATTHLAFSDLERGVMDNVCERIVTYSARGTNQALRVESMQQEFIVGIPQAIARFGRAVVDRVCPGLSVRFHNQFVADVRQWIANDQVTANQINNADAVATSSPPHAEHGAAPWLDDKTRTPGRFGCPGSPLRSLDALAELVDQEFRARVGVPHPGGPLAPPMMPYNITNFRLPEELQMDGLRTSEDMAKVRAREAREAADRAHEARTTMNNPPNNNPALALASQDADAAARTAAQAALAQAALTFAVVNQVLTVAGLVNVPVPAPPPLSADPIADADGAAQLALVAAQEASKAEDNAQATVLAPVRAREKASRDAIAHALAGADWAPRFSSDSLRALIRDMAQERVTHADDPAAMARAVGVRAKNAVRTSHVEYLQRRAATGPSITPREVAEQVVREAAYKALEASVNAGQVDPTLGPNMDDKKIKKLIDFMIEKLCGLPEASLAALLAAPAAFIQDESTAISGSKHAGLFTKAVADGSAPGAAQHVSVQEDNVRQTWTRRMAALAGP